MSGKRWCPCLAQPKIMSILEKKRKTDINFADVNGNFADVFEENQFYCDIFLPTQKNLNLKD